MVEGKYSDCFSPFLNERCFKVYYINSLLLFCYTVFRFGTLLYFKCSVDDD